MLNKRPRRSGASTAGLSADSPAGSSPSDAAKQGASAEQDSASTTAAASNTTDETRVETRRSTSRHSLGSRRNLTPVIALQGIKQNELSQNNVLAGSAIIESQSVTSSTGVAGTRTVRSRRSSSSSILDATETQFKSTSSSASVCGTKPTRSRRSSSSSILDATETQFKSTPSSASLSGTKRTRSRRPSCSSLIDNNESQSTSSSTGLAGTRPVRSRRPSTSSLIDSTESTPSSASLTGTRPTRSRRPSTSSVTTMPESQTPSETTGLSGKKQTHSRRPSSSSAVDTTDSQSTPTPASLTGGTRPVRSRRPSSSGLMDTTESLSVSTANFSCLTGTISSRTRKPSTSSVTTTTESQAPSGSDTTGLSSSRSGRTCRPSTSVDTSGSTASTDSQSQSAPNATGLGSSRSVRTRRQSESMESGTNTGVSAAAESQSTSNSTRTRTMRTRRSSGSAEFQNNEANKMTEKVTEVGKFVPDTNAQNKMINDKTNPKKGKSTQNSAQNETVTASNKAVQPVPDQTSKTLPKTSKTKNSEVDNVNFTIASVTNVTIDSNKTTSVQNNSGIEISPHVSQFESLAQDSVANNSISVPPVDLLGAGSIKTEILDEENDARELLGTVLSTSAIINGKLITSVNPNSLNTTNSIQSDKTSGKSNSIPSSRSAAKKPFTSYSETTLTSSAAGMKNVETDKSASSGAGAARNTSTTPKVVQSNGATPSCSIESMAQNSGSTPGGASGPGATPGGVIGPGEETKYVAGDMLWGKVSGHPWWPCMVALDPSQTQYCRRMNRGPSGFTQYHVQFFGVDVERGWVSENSVLPFHGRAAFIELCDKVARSGVNARPSRWGHKPELPVKRLSAWEQGVAYATEAFKVPTPAERAEKYSFIYYSTGKEKTNTERKRSTSGGSDTEKSPGSRSGGPGGAGGKKGKVGRPFGKTELSPPSSPSHCPSLFTNSPSGLTRSNRLIKVPKRVEEHMVALKARTRPVTSKVSRSFNKTRSSRNTETGSNINQSSESTVTVNTASNLTRDKKLNIITKRKGLVGRLGAYKNRFLRHRGSSNIRGKFGRQSEKTSHGSAIGTRGGIDVLKQGKLSSTEQNKYDLDVENDSESEISSIEMMSEPEMDCVDIIDSFAILSCTRRKRCMSESCLYTGVKHKVKNLQLEEGQVQESGNKKVHTGAGDGADKSGKTVESLNARVSVGGDGKGGNLSGRGGSLSGRGGILSSRGSVLSEFRGGVWSSKADTSNDKGDVEDNVSSVQQESSKPQTGVQRKPGRPFLNNRFSTQDRLSKQNQLKTNEILGKRKPGRPFAKNRPSVQLPNQSVSTVSISTVCGKSSVMSNTAKTPQLSSSVDSCTTESASVTRKNSPLKVVEPSTIHGLLLTDKKYPPYGTKASSIQALQSCSSSIVSTSNTRRLSDVVRRAGKALDRNLTSSQSSTDTNSKTSPVNDSINSTLTDRATQNEVSLRTGKGLVNTASPTNISTSSRSSANIVPGNAAKIISANAATACKIVVLSTNNSVVAAKTGPVTPNANIAKVITLKSNAASVTANSNSAKVNIVNAATVTPNTNTAKVNSATANAATSNTEIPDTCAALVIKEEPLDFGYEAAANNSTNTNNSSTEDESNVNNSRSIEMTLSDLNTNGSNNGDTEQDNGGSDSESLEKLTSAALQVLMALESCQKTPARSQASSPMFPTLSVSPKYNQLRKRALSPAVNNTVSTKRGKICSEGGKAGAASERGIILNDASGTNVDVTGLRLSSSSSDLVISNVVGSVTQTCEGGADGEMEGMEMKYIPPEMENRDIVGIKSTGTHVRGVFSKNSSAVNNSRDGISGVNDGNARHGSIVTSRSESLITSQRNVNSTVQKSSNSRVLAVTTCTSNTGTVNRFSTAGSISSTSSNLISSSQSAGTKVIRLISSKATPVTSNHIPSLMNIPLKQVTLMSIGVGTESCGHNVPLCLDVRHCNTGVRSHPCKKESWIRPTSQIEMISNGASTLNDSGVGTLINNGVCTNGVNTLNSNGVSTLIDNNVSTGVIVEKCAGICRICEKIVCVGAEIGRLVNIHEGRRIDEDLSENSKAAERDLDVEGINREDMTVVSNADKQDVNASNSRNNDKENASTSSGKSKSNTVIDLEDITGVNYMETTDISDINENNKENTENCTEGSKGDTVIDLDDKENTSEGTERVGSIKEKEGGLVGGGGAWIKCAGVCCGVFHVGCLKLEIPAGEKFTCEDCTSGTQECFICKKRDMTTVCCSVTGCGHFYHRDCTKQFPLTRWSDTGVAQNTAKKISKRASSTKMESSSEMASGKMKKIGRVQSGDFKIGGRRSSSRSASATELKSNDVEINTNMEELKQFDDDAESNRMEVDAINSESSEMINITASSSTISIISINDTDAECGESNANVVVPVDESSSVESGISTENSEAMANERSNPSASGKDMVQASVTCSLHACLKCYLEAPKSGKVNKGLMYRCVRCPVSYHYTDDCIPAGTVHLSGVYIICPRHVSEKPDQHRESKANWCFECKTGQGSSDLLTCSGCPAAYHFVCLKASSQPHIRSEALRSGGGHGWRCRECCLGKQPQCGDVVWYKASKSYRWWPAEICHPRTVPDRFRVCSRTDAGVFVVRLLATNTYQYTTRARVFQFQEGDTCSTTTVVNSLKSFYHTALQEASSILRLHTEFKESRSADNIRPGLSKNNRPNTYKHVKCNIPYGSVEIVRTIPLDEEPVCGCTAAMLDPCGPTSDCINRHMLYECHAAVCPAGAACRNQRFQKREDADTENFRTDKASRGWGLRCRSDLVKGQFVGEYVGDLIDLEESRRRLQEAHHTGVSNFYMLTLDRNRIIDAGPKGNHTRFMNHSCQPNCETQKWTVNGDVRIGVFTVEHIAAGTELTFNYNFDTIGCAKTACHCGASICSGYLGARPKTAAAAEYEKRYVASKQRRLQKKNKNSSNSNSALSLVRSSSMSSNSALSDDSQSELFISNLSSANNQETSTVTTALDSYISGQNIPAISNVGSAIAKSVQKKSAKTTSAISVRPVQKVNTAAVTATSRPLPSATITSLKSSSPSAIISSLKSSAVKFVETVREDGVTVISIRPNADSNKKRKVETLPTLSSGKTNTVIGPGVKQGNDNAPASKTVLDSSAGKPARIFKVSPNGPVELSGKIHTGEIPPVEISGRKVQSGEIPKPLRSPIEAKTCEMNPNKTVDLMSAAEPKKRTVVQSKGIWGSFAKKSTNASEVNSTVTSNSAGENCIENTGPPLLDKAEAVSNDKLNVCESVSRPASTALLSLNTSETVKESLSGVSVEMSDEEIVESIARTGNFQSPVKPVPGESVLRKDGCEIIEKLKENIAVVEDDGKTTVVGKSSIMEKGRGGKVVKTSEGEGAVEILEGESYGNMEGAEGMNAMGGGEETLEEGGGEKLQALTVIEIVDKRQDGGRKRKSEADLRCYVCLRSCASCASQQVVSCTVCGHLHHRNCVMSANKQNDITDWSCPWHHCMVCGEGSVKQCLVCPRAYCPNHVNEYTFSVANGSRLCLIHQQKQSDKRKRKKHHTNQECAQKDASNKECAQKEGSNQAQTQKDAFNQEHTQKDGSDKEHINQDSPNKEHSHQDGSNNRGSLLNNDSSQQDSSPILKKLKTAQPQHDLLKEKGSSYNSQSESEMSTTLSAPSMSGYSSEGTESLASPSRESSVSLSPPKLWRVGDESEAGDVSATPSLTSLNGMISMDNAVTPCVSRDGMPSLRNSVTPSNSQDGMISLHNSDTPSEESEPSLCSYPVSTISSRPESPSLFSSQDNSCSERIVS